MKLKMAHASARELLTAMYVQGGRVIQDIEHNYRVLRDEGNFDKQEHPAQWQRTCDGWYTYTVDAVERVFSTDREVIRLDNAQPSPLIMSGMSRTVSRLINVVRAK